MGTVTALYRYPVKSMLGEALTTAEVSGRGLHGDRVVAAIDGTGAVASAKHPRKWGALLRCRSRMAGTDTVVVELPDGTVLPVGRPDLDARLSELLGRNVALSRTPPEHGAVLERAVPEYEGGIPDRLRDTASADATGATVTSGRVAPGTFFDFGKVHLVTASALGRLRAVHPGGDGDARRFRPNLVVETSPGTGYPEDAWTGGHLRVGEALFRVVVPTPRCVVPALGQDELPADPALMRAVARDHRIPVLDLGRLSCVGVYLDVLEPGTVRLGDPVVRSGGDA